MGLALAPPVLDSSLHRARQIAERLRVGTAWTDLDLVFPSEWAPLWTRGTRCAPAKRSPVVQASVR